MAEPVAAKIPAVLDTPVLLEFDERMGPIPKRLGRGPLNGHPVGPWPLPVSSDDALDAPHGANGSAPRGLHAVVPPDGKIADATPSGSTSLSAVISTQLESLFAEFTAPLMSQFRELERERGRLEAELSAAVADRDDARAELLLLREILRSMRRDESRSESP